MGLMFHIFAFALYLRSLTQMLKNDLSHNHNNISLYMGNRPESEDWRCRWKFGWGKGQILAAHE